MIPVTKPYLPSRDKLNSYIDGIYERNWLTNKGPLVKELTERLEEYLGVENLLLVSNGTLALQIAYRTLGISGSDTDSISEAITTPFSFIATASSLKWEGVQPVFTDIDPETWCLDPAHIEASITANTRAIVPVHVFGNACDVDAIELIAAKNNLKVIYDAAHAFAVTYQGESLLKYGDAATLSFHATKLFHSIEGGAIVFKCKEDLEHAKKLINFGINELSMIEHIGINAKMNEFQAAMGLCVLDEIDEIKSRREYIWLKYKNGLDGTSLTLQRWNEDSANNHAYAPILFNSEEQLLEVQEKLKERNIFCRRYFYPSLDTVTYLDSSQECKVSRDIANRVLCLPMYPYLSNLDLEYIIDSVKN